MRNARGSSSQSAKSFIARTKAPAVTADPVVEAVTARASSPSVSPSQLAEAATWTTREARRAGRLNFMDATVPEEARAAVRRPE
ncbi:hypothetical protein GCM10010206_14920 [Streptomyces cinerochromogenes]|nr:hypothetical protein GCM10010206_14920 [Streptomyces cinerochromogenes]